jgi:hypothetical protein
MTTKPIENVNPALRRELKTLMRKYEHSQGKFQESTLERLRLLKEIMDRAAGIEHARLHVETHTVGQKKSESEHYMLSDPRAAMLLFERFCNVYVPLGNLFCIAKFGCKPFMKRPQDWLGCVLIGCFVNVCPTPGAIKVICVYLCV